VWFSVCFWAHSFVSERCKDEDGCDEEAMIVKWCKRKNLFSFQKRKKKTAGVVLADWEVCRENSLG